jgi:putative ABC transport system permease protein
VSVVAAVGILVGLYNTIQGRRREIAVLRAVGARPRHVFAVILTEALLLCVAGGLGGLLLGRVALLAAAPHLLATYGVLLDAAPGARDLAFLGVVVGLGLLAGVLPALRGLATPVAANLHPED